MDPTRERTSRYRVAILGAGGIAETHAAIIKSIPGLDLCAVCDPVHDKAARFGRKHGIPAVYGALDRMLQERRPDVVHVSTPPPAHAATATACLEAGAHVFVEKPFCVSSEECRRVASAAVRSKCQVGVNHNLAFHPAVRRAISAVEQRTLGGLEHVTVCMNVATPQLTAGPFSHWMFRDTGNVVFELGVHPLSIVHRFFGRITSSRSLPAGRVVLPSGAIFYSTWQISMVCERGTAHVYLSVGTGFTDFWIRIQGEDGICHADIRRNTVFLSEKSPLMRPNDDLRDAFRSAGSIVSGGLRNYRNYVLSSLRRKVPYPPMNEAMISSITAYYSALMDGRKPPAGLEEGTAVVEACEAAVEGGHGALTVPAAV